MVAPFALELNYLTNRSMEFTHIKPAKINLSHIGRLGEERVAVGVGGLDGGGELLVGEGLRVALLPLVGGMRVLAQGWDIGLGKPDLLKRHGQPHLLVKGSVALKVLGIARIGKQHEHAQAHDLAV